MAYTPEKAATVRCMDSRGATVGFAKLQGADDGRRSVDTLRAARRGIPEHGILRLPEAVGYLPEQHLALFSPAPGRPLHQLDRSAVPSHDRARRRALRAPRPTHRRVRAVHPAGRRPGGGRGPPGVRGPAGPGAAGRGARRRAAADGTRARPGVLLHGDLHPKNVLVHDSGVSLVDLDQAGVGPAARARRHAGQALAPRPRDEIDADTAEAAGEALLAAYDRPPSLATTCSGTPTALLVERAARAINRLDLATINDLEGVLATALVWARRRTTEDR